MNKINSIETWRVFCALELPESLQAKFEQHIQRLRKILPDAKASWGRQGNIHLTLKFFGDVEVEQIEKISNAASRSTQNVAPFAIGINGAGAFPSVNHPRVLWIGISDPEKELTKLHQSFDLECEAEGFPKEARAFYPHLTIARCREGKNAKDLSRAHQELGFENVIVPVREIVVFRSQLSSAGSKYTVISRHEMRR